VRILTNKIIILFNSCEISLNHNSRKMLQLIKNLEKDTLLCHSYLYCR